MRKVPLSPACFFQSFEQGCEEGQIEMVLGGLRPPDPGAGGPAGPSHRCYCSGEQQTLQQPALRSSCCTKWSGVNHDKVNADSLPVVMRQQAGPLTGWVICFALCPFMCVCKRTHAHACPESVVHSTQKAKALRKVPDNF